MSYTETLIRFLLIIPQINRLALNFQTYNGKSIYYYTYDIHIYYTMCSICIYTIYTLHMLYLYVDYYSCYNSGGAYV